MVNGVFMQRVFVIGYPGDVGGANTECWHTVRLWRRFGLPVTLIPTWRPQPAWQRRLEAIGCETIPCTPDALDRVPGLAGSTVVSFCNANFLLAAPRFRALRCPVVWVNCMTWLFRLEREHYRTHGPFEAFVFQSRHQEQCLMPELSDLGVAAERCHLIRGAFDVSAFPFNPRRHRAGEPLVVGRLSRAARDKYSSNTWPILRRIPYPVRARLMAWSAEVEAKLGRPPEWAQCLPAGAETPQQFLSRLHCMLQVNGGAGENWPRSGLEAMAGGVPIVVPNRWGWREMLRHGETGFLCDGDEDLAYWPAHLARHEDQRMAVAAAARRAVELFADPPTLWKRWQGVFGSVKSEV